MLQIHQLFISKPLMIINTAIPEKSAFLIYKSRVWREFHLIMILSITELALVRFGYHVCFIDKENEFLSNSLSHSLVCCSLHFGPDPGHSTVLLGWSSLTQCGQLLFDALEGKGVYSPPRSYNLHAQHWAFLLISPSLPIIYHQLFKEYSLCSIS